jgi:hypothetical protein
MHGVSLGSRRSRCRELALTLPSVAPLGTRLCTECSCKCSSLWKAPHSRAEKDDGTLLVPSLSSDVVLLSRSPTPPSSLPAPYITPSGRLEFSQGQ